MSIVQQRYRCLVSRVKLTLICFFCIFLFFFSFSFFFSFLSFVSFVSFIHYTGVCFCFLFLSPVSLFPVLAPLFASHSSVSLKVCVFVKDLGFQILSSSFFLSFFLTSCLSVRKQLVQGGASAVAIGIITCTAMVVASGSDCAVRLFCEGMLLRIDVCLLMAMQINQMRK